MNKLTVDDLYPLETYARLRPEFRERVIEHKAHRRLSAGRASVRWLSKTG